MRPIQEEVNEKIISICVNSGKMSARVLKEAMTKTLARLEREAHRRQDRTAGNTAVYRGKQSMEKLKAQNVELSNIEITDGNIKSFEKCARKYSIDYCLKKDRNASPPRYYVFFKAKDVDAITAAFREYTGKLLKVNKKTSILKKLQLAKERAAKHRERVKEKQKDRGPEH